MLNVHLPLNNLSFGHCSILILKELYDRGMGVNLFLIQNPADVSSFTLDQDFQFWLSSCAGRAKKNWSRKDPSFKLWHLNGSEAEIGNDTTLFTFHELDSITPTEANICKNHKKVLVSSKTSEQVFREAGVENVLYCPLGFDSLHFKKLNRPKNPNNITFSLFGKFEKRKHTEKVLRAWIKKYGAGGNAGMGFTLNVHVYNPFFNPEQNNQIIGNIVGTNKPWNVNFLPYTKTLAELNDGLNASDIVIDMSGGEGFSLPSFSAIALGKHGVIHNCSSLKDWAPDSGAVMVEPGEKEDVYDGAFFRPGDEFNQGKIFGFDEEAFLNGCEQAIQKFRQNPINEQGKTLQQKYTWKNTTDIILENL